MKPKKRITKWIYWFSLGVAFIIIYKFVNDFSSLCMFIKRIFSVTMPFLIAILISYLFYKPVVCLENLISKSKILKNIARPISIFSVYIIAGILIALLINLVIPPVRDSVTDLVTNIPSYIEELKNAIDNADEDSILKNINTEEIMKRVASIDFAAYLSTEKLIEYVNTVIGIFGAIFNVFVTIVVSIYLLLERGKIKEFFKRLGKAVLDEPTYNKACKYFGKSNHIFLDFIYCQILDGIIIGILASIAMAIMHVKYAILLGFFIGLFNIIPYFGAIIAIAVSILITIFTGGLEQAIIMALTVIILQQIDANIINPKILGDGLKISPILIIFAVTIGGEFFGILGMFLAVPIIAILKLLVLDYIEIKIKLKAYRKNKERIKEN